MPLLRRTQPIGRNDIREKATRLQVRHLATKPRHLLRCASNMMTVKQAQAQGTSLPLCRSCRDKLGQQSTGESAETATRDALEENGYVAKMHGGDMMGVKPHFLFSLGSHSKQAGDERNLPQNVSFFHTTHLPFPHHVHDLISL